MWLKSINTDVKSLVLEESRVGQLRTESIWLVAICLFAITNKLCTKRVHKHCAHLKSLFVYKIEFNKKNFLVLILNLIFQQFPTILKWLWGICSEESSLKIETRNMLSKLVPAFIGYSPVEATWKSGGKMVTSFSMRNYWTLSIFSLWPYQRTKYTKMIGMPD